MVYPTYSWVAKGLLPTYDSTRGCASKLRGLNCPNSMVLSGKVQLTLLADDATLSLRHLLEGNKAQREDFFRNGPNLVI